jgi:hypothetical protein
MAIINYDGISGISSITATGSSVQFYNASGGVAMLSNIGSINTSSISGINSITAQSNSVTFYNSSGGTTVISGISSISDSSGGYLSNPPGTIITVASSTAPAGHLKANGASLSTTTYAALFAAIGYTFGGSGASFTLPDLRGQFIRGWVDNGSTDSGRTFGSSQTDAFQGHWHQYTGTTTDNAGGIGGIIDGPNTQTGGGGNLILGPISDGSNGSPRTSTETRPVNIALLHCIKY